MGLRPGLLMCCQLFHQGTLHPWMLVFLSFEIASCCVAQDDLELVFFLTSSLKITDVQHHTRPTLGILNSVNSTCSMASRGLKSDSKLQPPLVIHPLTLSSLPLGAGLFLYEDLFALNLDIGLLGFLLLCLPPFKLPWHCQCRHWANQLPTSATTKYHPWPELRQQPCLLMSNTCQVAFRFLPACGPHTVVLVIVRVQAVCGRLAE